MLVSSLRRRGHEAVMLPLYLPVITDCPTPSDENPVFLGGVNVYLQQKSALFRKTPRWLDRVFDSRALLRFSSRFAHMTRAKDLGELTVSMLRGEEGNQRKEIDRLVDWLARNNKPDVVCLSNALLIGMARRIRTRLEVPVVCTLQGEDYFLDSLPEPERGLAWETLAERSGGIDLFIAVSEYYANVMRDRLGLYPEKVAAVHNGIDVELFFPPSTPPAPPAVGYLGRLCREKGLHTLIESFVLLKKNERHKDLKLKVAGTMTHADETFVEALRMRAGEANVGSDLEISPNIPLEKKIDFLGRLSVFSVPATYGEAFGLYLLEAMAMGVPVVQPEHASFPEILEATGGGLLCEPDDPESLAEKIGYLLDHPDEARDIGRRGRDSVRESFSMEKMTERILEQLKGVVDVGK
jgi:glycosyltransferase involved in cell wall biosynthesis